MCTAIITTNNHLHFIFLLSNDHQKPKFRFTPIDKGGGEWLIIVPDKSKKRDISKWLMTNHNKEAQPTNQSRLGSDWFSDRGWKEVLQHRQYEKNKDLLNIKAQKHVTESQHSIIKPENEDHLVPLKLTNRQWGTSNSTSFITFWVNM